MCDGRRSGNEVAKLASSEHASSPGRHIGRVNGSNRFSSWSSERIARYASRVPTPTSGIRSSLPRNRIRFKNSRRTSPRPASTLCSSSITSVRTPTARSSASVSLLELGQALPRAQRRAHRGEQRHVEADHRRLRRHLDGQHRDLLVVRVGHRRVHPPELLNDHRLAVVRRADQQQVRHPLLVRARRTGPPAGPAPRWRGSSRSTGPRARAAASPQPAASPPAARPGAGGTGRMGSSATSPLFDHQRTAPRQRSASVSGRNDR